MKKFDDLKGLPPEERIRKLREIAEEDKKEIETAQKMLTESEAEAKEDYQKYQNIPVPQMRAIDIGQLFSPEEKQLFQAKRPGEVAPKQDEDEEEKQEVRQKQEQDLEETVSREASQFSRQAVEQQQQYIHHLATNATAHDLYRGISDLGRAAHDQGYLNEEQQRQLVSFYQAAREKEEAMSQGAYSANATTSKQIESILGFAYELKKNYQQ